LDRWVFGPVAKDVADFVLRSSRGQRKRRFLSVGGGSAKVKREGVPTARWGGSAPSGLRWSRFACEGGRLEIRRAGFAEWLTAAFAGGHARSEGCLGERSGVLARRQLGQEVLRAARLEERAVRFVRGREARQGRGRRGVEGLALQRLDVRGRLRTISLRGVGWPSRCSQREGLRRVCRLLRSFGSGACSGEVWRGSALPRVPARLATPGLALRSSRLADFGPWGGREYLSRCSLGWVWGKGWARGSKARKVTSDSRSR